MAFFGTLNTDEAKSTKVFPTFELNSVSWKIFFCLNFVYNSNVAYSILLGHATNQSLLSPDLSDLIL